MLLKRFFLLLPLLLLASSHFLLELLFASLSSYKIDIERFVEREWKFNDILYLNPLPPSSAVHFTL
jgi:hypothetical protein